MRSVVRRGHAAVRGLLPALAFLLVSVPCCGGQDTGRSSSPPDTHSGLPAQKSESAVKGETVMALRISSTAFEEGQRVPILHTCAGQDLSPALVWTGVPQGTRSLALFCDDPDAPIGTWVHWVVFNIPADSTGLAQGIPREPKLADGTVQGKNSWKRVGYNGPCPPPGKPHRYVFKLYALDALLSLDANAAERDVVAAMRGHILAEAQVIGTYGR